MTTQLNRRQFVKGLTLTSVSAALGSHLPKALANPTTLSNPNKQPILTGTEFDLTISQKTVNITGNPRKAVLVNGSLPAPTLVWREGDTITLRVKNELDEDTSIHWHGIILPTRMDGVPGFSFAGIKPGETYHYQFTVQQHGTYWYHSHSGYQEQLGLYGAIVILPKKAEPLTYDKDYVIQLSDWSDEDPETIYANLKKQADYYNYSQRTLGDFWNELKQKGFIKARQDRKMWNQMRMTDRDISDVTGATYTFLMNGLSPNAHWRAVVQSGEKVRLRFINSSAMTFFDVRIPGLKMTVVAADGNLIQPVEVDEFRIGVAETYDVIVEPDTSQQPYAIFAQAIDRSGYAIGSLTASAEQLAPAPEMDPVPVLSMQDMGMSMEDMQHMGHDMPMGPMKMVRKLMGNESEHNQDTHNMSHQDSHKGGHAHHTPKHTDNPTHQAHQTPDYTHALAMEKMKMGLDVSDIDHSKHPHDPSTLNVDLDQITIPMDMNPDLPQIEVPRKRGPHTTMKAMSPQYRLADPGVGLRNNGRRVLTYADLKNYYATRHDPKPTKELVLHLTGNMERYRWQIDGIPLDEAPPLKFEFGERIRFTLINDTMMNHPMHLHGVWSDLETGDENHIPRKHTVIVQPGSKISFRVTMDAEGDWAFHCHLLYHMMGMFRRVQIRKTTQA